MKKLVTLIVCMLCTVLAFTQNRIVTGTVTDEKGVPVEGATVKIKGSKKAVIADANGKFSVSATKGTTLGVSGARIPEKQVTVGEDNFITINVTHSSAELSTVVVTALGINREAKSLGYAVSSISNKTLTQAKSVNVAQSLNGKISGLNISTVNSGVFEDAKINIRGIRSLTGNNSPMLVVDGAPTPLSYLASIPPDDVADLTVLKSAASAAIYGPDAVNGVIVINTKRGSRNPTITIGSTIQASRVAFFPKLQTKFGDGGGETTDEYGNFTYVPYENQQFGPAFDGTMRPIGKVLEDGSIQMVPYNNSHAKDKIKFYNTGLTFQNSASIAGEDYYVGIEDAKIKGLVPDDINHRTSLRFNGGKKFNNFSMNYGLNFISNNSDVVNESAFNSSFPGAYDGGLFFLVMQTAANIPLLSYKDLNSKFAQYSNYYNEFSVNPYWLIKNIRSKSQNNNLIGNIALNYQFFPWLKASVKVSSDMTFSNTKNTNAPIIVTDYAHANRANTQYSNRNGIVSNDQFSSNRINLDYFLSGDTKIKNDLSVKYILGGMARQNSSKDVAVGGNNLVVPYLYNVGARSGDASVSLYPYNNYEITSTLLSAYGSLGFSFKGWANIEFTGRNDWDSRLLQQNRSFFYPSVNASVVLSDVMGALKNSNTISYLKIRAAASKSGNVNLDPYSLSATYSQPGGFPYGNVVGYTANSVIPSTNLLPEFVNTKEAGIELGLSHNKINLEATYFFQKNINQILTVSQSSATGYVNSLANAADFKNYGVEMDLGLTPLIKLGKGKFDLKINATYNNNQITRTNGNQPVVLAGSSNFIQNFNGGPTINNIAVVGGPAFAFQLTDYLRDPTTGKVIIDTVTGLPSQAPEMAIRGRSLPLWVVGISPSYSLGAFSIGMTWDYKGGHDFFSGLGADADFAGISARSAEYDRQRFVFPNSVYLKDGKYVPNTNIQVQDGNYGFWQAAVNTAIATNYFASAAAIRLRELNISYNLPTKLLGKAVKKVTISAVGKNLLLFVPKSNQWGDPEFNYSSVGNTFGVASSFQTPASRLFGGSITVQF